MAKKVVANLKMNLLFSDVKGYIDTITANVPPNLIICPPFLYVPYFLNKNIKLGAQNCCWEDAGTYTGEISPLQLKHMKVDYVLIGHSERREHFWEDEVVLKWKIAAALNAGLQVIYCVGENALQRENDETFAVIQRQLQAVLTEVSKEKLSNITIAYEPVWAIGSSQTPTDDEIIAAVEYIKSKVRNLLEVECEVLYGGSVDLENIEKLNSIVELDGFLVGSASLEADKLLQICQKVKEGD